MKTELTETQQHRLESLLSGFPWFEDDELARSVARKLSYKEILGIKATCQAAHKTRLEQWCEYLLSLKQREIMAVIREKIAGCKE